MENNNYSYNSSYPESGHSSPLSREIELENPPPWEGTQGNQPPSPNYKVKFMCSYGGKIHPRPHDNQLSYIGGETKILAVDRDIKFASLLSKLVALCGDNEAILFKYQLPGEDLDALISVANDDDLEHMMHEYDRLFRASPRPARLRIFVFPSLNNPSLNSSRSFEFEDVKTEKDRFVEALNTAAPPAVAAAAPQLQPPPANVDFLFGLEKPNVMAEVEDPVVHHDMDEKLIGSDPIQKHIHDLQRLRMEDQEGMIYGRKIDDNPVLTPGGGEYYNYNYNYINYKVPVKNISQAPIPGGVPAYWTEKQLQSPPGGGGGVFRAGSNEQQVYMIPGAGGGGHVRAVPTPSQGGGYYTVQRMIPPEQVHFYSMIPPQAQAQAQAQAVSPPTLSILPQPQPLPQKTTAPTPAGLGVGLGGYAYDGRQVVQYHVGGGGGALNVQVEGSSKGVAPLPKTPVTTTTL
ncbi:uncharacterized protein LOC127252569 [Andrographis paniculata]|uniref:uncharacterized protein LOC127252569 n=1 Tax=Andrographis paniculata TaxID=175694 RepID=UPI0021E91E83|nr:uncharacterized protein LOC127252569 [Andrographis paniculata]